MSDKDDRTPDFESGGVRDQPRRGARRELAILPLRDTILFPHAILPLAVARESSVALVHDAVRERKVIGVVTQRDPAIDDPVESDLYRIGTLTHIHKMFKFPDGSLRLVVQGVQRFRLHPGPAVPAVPARPASSCCTEAVPAGAGDRGQGARPERAGPLPARGRALPHPLRRAADAGRQHPGPEPAGRLHRRQPALAHHRRRSRRCWRRSTCARASSASTRCWSRTSRCSRSATRSRAR